MSANKCKTVSKLMEPLVLNIRRTSKTEEEFAEKLNEYFEDGTQIAEQYWMGGNKASRPINPFTVEKKTINTQDSKFTLSAMYTTDSAGFKSLKSRFVKDVVERVLFNPNSGEWFLPEQEDDVTGFSNLNKTLFEYKVELINTIREHLDKVPFILDITSDNIQSELTNAINSVIEDYQKSELSLTEIDQQAFAILSNFNDLLKEWTPFIKTNRLFEKSNKHAVKMYEYVGPKANLRQSWTVNEIVGAQEQYSGLSKILLDYFQECDENGNPLENTSIGAAGFASVMTTLRSAILFNPALRHLKEEYFKGSQINMNKVIDEYLDYINSDTGFKSEHKTFLKSKLNGIKYNIYRSNMREDLRDMFTRMFYETVPMEYRTYGTYNGVFKGTDLRESWVNNQNYRLQDSLNGKIYTFRTNRNNWATIRKRYNINVEGDRQTGKITLTLNDSAITIKYNKRNNSFEFVLDEGLSQMLDNKFTDKLIYDLTGYLVTPEYKTYSLQYSKNNTPLKDFVGAIGISILAVDKTSVLEDAIQGDLVGFNRYNLFGNLKQASAVAAITKGSETSNTVKDVNGNNLPTRGLTSLAYELPRLLNEYEKNFSSPYHYNLLFQNQDWFGTPVIREGISKQGSGKKSSNLIESELYEASIIYDFLNELSSGKILLQPTIFADKTKHFLISYDLKGNWMYEGENYRMQELFQQISRKPVNGEIKKIESLIQNVRRNRYNRLAQNVVDAYNEVFDNQFDNIAEIDNYLVDNNISIKQLKQLFGNHTFIDEVTATNIDGIARINETLMNRIKTYNDDSRFAKRIDRSKRAFVGDLISSGLKLNRYYTRGGRDAYDHLSKHNSSWINEKSGNIIFAKAFDGKNEIIIDRNNIDILSNPNYKIEINPIFNAYFYADYLFSNEYNALLIGEDFAHKSKNSAGDKNLIKFDETEYEEFSEASRWVAAAKRSVIPGASIHPFLHGLKNGVADEILVACMDDIPASTFNMFGQSKNNNDSMDGSGISNIYEALLELNSLVDAAPNGVDLKTIGWDIDSTFGTAEMLKWAVYSLTNARRRMSSLSSVNGENLMKKMNNIPINKVINLISYFNKFGDNFYFKVVDPQTYYKVIGVENINGVFARRCVEVKSNGEPYSDSDSVYVGLDGNVYDPNQNPEKFTVNNIYDIDTFFGGAYAMQLKNNTLEYSELNNTATLDIICNENLKDKFIAYAVNKSAMKVGYRNINSISKWSDDNKLSTFSMSTWHIGLQMNAEHELLDSEVTEMTQMISALAENWYAGDLVKDIYRDIGEVVEESLRSINTEIASGNRDALRVRLGKALIESFTKKQDTIGLAQAFLSKAQKALQNGELPNIPFSASTINGAFIADVASRLTKKGIRRKYDGIAAVLSPSFNFISYFDLGDGQTGLADEVYQRVQTDIANNHFDIFSSTPVQSLINDVLVKNDLGEYVQNPLLVEIENSYNLKQGDTIVSYTIAENGTKVYSDKVVLESWKDYNKWVNNTPENTNILKFKYAPRNLQGADTRFNVNGVNYSIYNLKSVIASHEVSSGSLTNAEIICSDEYFVDDLVLDGQNIDYKSSLRNIIQHQLEDLERGFIHDALFNGTVDVTDVNVIEAECIMGRLNAEKFGLKIGDDISAILKNPVTFFKTRFDNKYGTLLDVPSELYDAIVYTTNGPILIHVGDFQNPEQFNLSRNKTIDTLEDDYIIGEEILCSAEGKKKYSYLSKAGETYNVICLSNAEQFDDLLDSGLIEQHRYNLNRNNVISVLKLYDPNGELYGNLAQTQGINAVYEILSKQLQADFEAESNRLARRRAESFRESLRVVGARIPTQAMQSFMPMRVVGLTDSLTNDIYVPRQQLWLQGSDLDIDKVYTLAYSIAPNGTIPTMSRLDKYFAPQEVLKLGKPKGIRYGRERVGQDVANTYQVSFNELQEMFSTNKLDLFRKIIQSGKSKISFEAPINMVIETTINNGDKIKETNLAIQDDFEKMVKQFMQYLNLHSLSNIKQNRELALRNYVVNGILEATTKPSVQINANAPIEMDEATEAGESSILGNLEKHFSADIPSSKIKLQQQAMVGKDVIGITAVSVKTFFAATTYVNTKLEEFTNQVLSGNHQEALRTLNNIVIVNPLDEQVTILANSNIKKILEVLQANNISKLENIVSVGRLNNSSWIHGHTFDIISCLKYLENRSNKVDAALSQSGLLSSATDNMKELILPKINATSDFADIYTTLLATGIPFARIAQLMTSPVFTEMSKMVKSNILDNTSNGYNLERILDFYLNRRVLPHVNTSYLLQIFGSGATKQNVLELTKNNTFVENALNKLYDQRKNKLSRSYGSEEDYFNDYFNGDLNEESGYSNLADASLEELNVLINYLEECINRNKLFEKVEAQSKEEQYARFGGLEQQLSDLALLRDNILPKTEEQRIFGNMLGINQGLPTDGYKMYSLIRRIENFINSRIRDGINDGRIKNIDTEFKLSEFLNGDKSVWIDAYDKVKKTYNILDAITNVPHFAKMFDVLYTCNYLQSALSSKTQLVNNIARQLEAESAYGNDPYTRVLREKEYNEVERFVNDWYITGWLSKQNLKFNIPEGSRFYTSVNGSAENRSLSKPLDLSNLYNVATFKKWVEEVVVPNLQQNPKYNGEQGEQNEFIMSLELAAVKNKKTGKLSKYYKLPLNMMSIDDSVLTQRLYENYLSDFNAIANVNYNGWSLGDLFFVYSLIVNKDSFGQTSMTRIFEDLVASERGSSLINSFYDYIADIDNSVDRTQIINNILNSSTIMQDVKDRIKFNVPESNINGSTNQLKEMKSDFTFNMPNSAKNWTTIENNIFPVSKPKTLFNVSLSESTIRPALLSHLQSVYGDSRVQIHPQQWFEENFKDDPIALSAPAFIDNGVVYFKSEQSTTTESVAHELTHLILAAMRFNEGRHNSEDIRKTYYRLVGMVDIDQAKQDFPGSLINEYEQQKTGIDLKEEIFAKYLERWLSNKLPTGWKGGIVLNSNSDKIIDVVNDVLGTNLNTIQDLLTFTNSKLDAAIEIFGSNLFDTDWAGQLNEQVIIDAQKVSSLKKSLENDGWLAYKCY